MTRFNWKTLGHDSIKIFLERQCITENAAHALLFYGKNNIGKNALLKEYIQSFFCIKADENKDELPCENCEHCQKSIFDHPDVYVVKQELHEKTGKVKNLSIKQVRELRKWAIQSPFLHKYKFIVIQNAHTLTIPAANSLLKVLEEPPEDTKFILTAEYIHTLPETIISRTIPIHFYPVPKKIVEKSDLLKDQKIPDELQREYLNISQGRIGVLEKFLHDLKYQNEYQEYVQDFLHMISIAHYQRLPILKKYVDNKQNELLEIFAIWELLLRDILLMYYKQSQLVKHISVKGRIKAISQHLNKEKLIISIKELHELEFHVKNNGNLQLLLENFFLKFNP